MRVAQSANQHNVSILTAGKIRFLPSCLGTERFATKGTAIVFKCQKKKKKKKIAVTQAWLSQLSGPSLSISVERISNQASSWQPEPSAAAAHQRLPLSFETTPMFTQGEMLIPPATAYFLITASSGASVFKRTRLSCPIKTHVRRVERSARLFVAARSDSWMCCFCENQKGFFLPNSDWRLALWRDKIP